MTSNPIFSTKELRIFLLITSMLGLYLIGLGIGEHIQIYFDSAPQELSATMYVNELFFFLSGLALVILACGVMTIIVRVVADILKENEVN